MDFIEQMNRNWEKLNKQDTESKQKGILVGRYIKEPCADSFAVYEIVKENKNTVKIKVCTGLGDDWQISYWGSEATIKKSYAIEQIQNRDILEKLFNKG